MTTLSGTLQAESITNVCPKAPAGVSGYVNDIISWVKYGVILLVACFTPVVLFRMLAFVDPDRIEGLPSAPR